MSSVHVVTGAGPVGSTVARQLADAGEQVRLLTRSGSGPVHPLIDRRRVDVSRPDALTEAFQGAAAVHHCIHGSAYAAKVWRAELPGPSAPSSTPPAARVRSSSSPRASTPTGRSTAR